jgi:hypothetical protein
MSEERKKPTYYDPDTFESVEFPEGIVELIKGHEPHLAVIQRMTYRGATLLLSDEDKARIMLLDASISNAWPSDPSQVSPRLNMSGAQYLLEFGVLSPDDLLFLLYTFARQRSLHCYIGDEISDAFFLLHQKGEISLLVLRFFVSCFRKLDYLGGFLAKLESENPIVLDTVEKRIQFTQMAIDELKKNKEPLFEAWKVSQWEQKKHQEGVTEQEKEYSFYDLALMSLELALTRFEKKHQPYGDQEENYLYFLPGKEEKFDGGTGWIPDQADLDLPDDFGAGAA